MNAPGKTTALSVDLNSFIYGVSRRNFQNASELTKIGLSLLKNFPAARDAVLEYFAMVFHEAVNISVNQSDYEADTNTGGPIESVSVIGPELISLGESWAPIIAPWCINLIMDIATDKANLPNSTLQNSDPVRVLLDITTQNLTLLNNDERAKCIDMMIGCRACSWAVGWVGRAEPALVAPRALALGPEAARAVLAHLAHHPPARLHLRNALKQLFEEAIKDNAKPEKKRDVIPYLLNLASKSDIVLKALTEDIEKTLSARVVDRLAALAGPALLPLLLPLLLRCPASCLLLLLRLAAERAPCRQLLEHLLQKLEYESLYPENNIPMITSAAEDIHILQEKLLVGNRLEQYSIARVLILVCYSTPTAFVNLIGFLLQYSRSDTTLALLVRIVSGTISMHTPNDSPDLTYDTDKYHNYIKTGVEYGLRDAIISDTQIKLSLVEGKASKDQKTYLHHYCLNIIKLLRWEGSGRVGALRGGWASAGVAGSLRGAAGALRAAAAGGAARGPGGASRGPGGAARGAPHRHADLPEMPTCHALAEVLDRVDMSGTKCPPPSVEVIIKLLQATVLYFFRCLHETDILVKIRGVQTACRIFRKLCLHSKLARAIALRDLLETAMFKEEQVFGSKSVIANTITQAKDWTDDDLLLNLNQKYGPITQLTQSHSSVFHAGIIGRGVSGVSGVSGPAARAHPAHPAHSAHSAHPAHSAHSPHHDADTPRVLTTNNELLMGALMSCMEGNSGVVEGCTSLSLLLVELVAPDVMYNGLPWPDEDFTKQVSIERELYMRCAVERSCCVRGVLSRAAAAPPALCLASALLRARAATLLHTLRAMLDRHSQSAEMRRERASLNELLSTMALGQLLPHPLSHMLELAPELTSSEIVQMLRDCVWNYTRDHVPSPALFTCDSTGLHWRDPSTCKPPATYTDTLRLIIQKKISTLGHLYPIMFLNLEKDTPNTE